MLSQEHHTLFEAYAETNFRIAYLWVILSVHNRLVTYMMEQLKMGP